MKLINIKFFKIVISILLAVNISINNSYALFGVGDIVFDPAGFANTLISSVKAGASYVKDVAITANTFSSSLSSGNLFLKENFLDRIAYAIANSAIASLKGELANAISGGGIDGGSAFLDNPEQFFQSIAKDQELLIKKELLGAVGGVLGAQNEDIYKLFSEGVTNDATQTKALFQKSITSTIGSTICSKLNTDLQKAVTLKEDVTTISLLRASYAASCTAGDKVTQYQNQKDCAKNFSCGGFDSILAITQNLGQNTDAGRYESALAKYQKDTAKKTDEINKELDRGNGFLNKKKCVTFEKVENKEVCIKYENESPGIAAANSLQKLITSPIDENLRVDEIGEFVSSLASRFLTSLVSKGIKKGTDAIRDGISNEIASIQSPSSLSSGSQPAPGTSGTVPVTLSETLPTSEPSLELGTDGAAAYLSINKPLIDAARQENKDARPLVQKELNVYSNVLNSYKQVDTCYIQKESQRIIPGSTAIPYPQSIPSQVSDRITDLSSKARNLQNIIRLSEGVDVYVNEKIVAMSISTNLKVLDFYREKIFKKIESSDSLKDSDWGIRDANNTYGADGNQAAALYTLLADEAVKTLKNVVKTGFGDNAKSEDISPLAACNAFDPNPQLQPVDNSGGNN